MSINTTDIRPHELLVDLNEARRRSDEMFALISPEALYERPIPERHRIVFYLGHLEAFDWNLICAGSFAMRSPQPQFDQLFAFGIDPTNGGLPQDQPHDWPRELEIRRYNARIRGAVDECLNRAANEQLFHVALEHRLMHVETLAYMLHWLPQAQKNQHVEPIDSATKTVAMREVDIPGGVATLGLRRDDGTFGWDNEFEAHAVPVRAFAIDAYKVTNADYLKFVEAGGYDNPSFWDAPAWKWIGESGIKQPHFWIRQGSEWLCRTMFADVAFQPAWPVYVSHAEATAYCRWRGASLPSEAQFHRAAFGTPEGLERQYPWGDAAPRPRHGNFDFSAWNPTRVDSHPDGNSAFGVAGLVGNGWEWTATPFAPFPGFQRFAFYPGYSADFFDGNHYVMKGGSPRTAAVLLRRSFRNWFQPLYPNIYASFRCVKN